MSKYTTEVRFIVENACGLTESEGYASVNQLIDTACPLIFNFDFPIFDEAYRGVLERKILKHYYTREIGMETVGLWKLQLDRKLNEIMPYYNKMYEGELIKINPLYNYSLSKNTLRTTKENSNNNYNTSEIEKNSSNGSSVEVTNGSNSSSEIGSSKGINKYSDTPQGGLNGVINNNYLTNATEDENVNNNVQNGENKSNRNNVNSNENDSKRNTMGTNVQENNSTEGYIDEVVGHMSNSESNLILEYRKTFLNIDMMIIDELSDLFMNLW